MPPVIPGRWNRSSKRSITPAASESSAALRLEQVTDQNRLEAARDAISGLAKSVGSLAARIDEDFTRAVDLILATKGHVVVIGMGKSGLIGQKIAATLASTGTPSFAVHPSEAFHGDLGMIRADDLVLMLSYSGETDEIVRLLPWLGKAGIPVIALVGKKNSRLTRAADVSIDVSVESEVCPHNLAPTSSTLATLAMGDVLAVALMTERQFGPADFANLHPGGSLGRHLLTKVSDVMRAHDLPFVQASVSVQDALFTISSGRMGLALVMEHGKLVGIVTDGDLRRSLQSDPSFIAGTIDSIMTANPRTIHEDRLLHEGHTQMRKERISALVVVDDAGDVTGVLDAYCG